MAKPIVKIAEARLYTVHEAAGFFRMSASWVRKRISAGDLDAFLCGNLLISGQSMNRYLANRAVWRPRSVEQDKDNEQPTTNAAGASAT